MNYKKIILISLMVLILSVTAVSAADLDDDYAIESSDAVDSSVIGNSFEETLEIQDSENLGASTGTFNDLQALVDNAPKGSVLELNMDYTGSKNSRIQLNKDLTIDGKGHTIDCLDKSGCSAFYSTSGIITLKNLRIINGHNGDTNNGGAIYITNRAKYTIENCTFENNWADDCGGAIYNGAPYKLTVSNCIFKSNEADDSCGGAIYSLGSFLIKDSKFLSNYAPNYGGAVYADVPSDIINCIFESNKVGEDHGGAVYAKANIKISKSTFKNNFAGYSGGALSAFKDVEIDGCLFESNKVDGVILMDACGGAIECDGTLYINNSTFKDNHADDRGGAIDCKDIYINHNQDSNQPINTFFINNKADDIDGGAINARGKVVMKNAEFTSNKAYVDGGAILADDDVTMSNCLFDSNKADGAVSQCYGGAVRSKGDVNIESSTFKNNYAHDYGGAIYADAVNINVNQAYPQDYTSFFKGNKASDNKGGAIYAEDDVKAVNTVFSENSADVDGGAIYSDDSVYVTNCYFDNNKADGAKVSQCYGGAIRAEGDVHVESSRFQSNYAHDYGGAIYADAVYINVNQDRNQGFTSYFSGNKAGDNKGGAIYTDDGVFKAVNTVFFGNKALVDGGAVYADDDINVTNCLFEENKAQGAKILECYGGAFRTQDNAVVDNCTFRNNYAGDDGGAIYVDDNLWLYNSCVFEGNIAGDNGGAIYTAMLSSDVIRSRFIGNKAKSEDGGAVYIDGTDDTIKFTGCLFVDNTCGDEGGAIYADDMSSKVYLKYNIFVGNDAKDTGDSVYCCGNYGEIINNYWGGKNPSKNNGQLIEWMPLFLKNKHHSDKDPLTLGLMMTGSAVVGETVSATQCFYTSDGNSLPARMLTDAVVFDAPNLDIINRRSNLIYQTIDFAARNVGSYKVTATLYGQSVSKTLQVSDVKITVPDIVAYRGGYQTLNIHLDGDLISNKRVEVSFDSRYYGTFTDKNGDASVLMDMLYIDPGRYDIIVNVYGINVTSAITIQSTIYGEDLYTVYGNESEFEVRFLDNQGQNLTTGRLISYQIDGQRMKHTFMQNDEGIMAFDISSLTPGEHSITVINQLTKENKTFDIIVLQQPDNLLGENTNQQNETVPDDDTESDDHEFPLAPGDDDVSDRVDQSPVDPAGDVSANNKPARLNTLYGSYSVGDSGSVDESVKSNSGDSGNQSNSTAPVKSIAKQSNGSSGFNYLWILLLIVVVAVAGVLIKKYKN